ncbi:hypothetical protein N8303_04265 [Gammaproteobacteria bacterium]|nr:hypothetical protein [Gammaproteobacteria bacterium]
MNEELTGQSVEQLSSAQQDLAIIKKMMLEAQNSAALDGRFLILWGVVLALPQLYIFIRSSFLGVAADAGSIVVWFVALGIGICGSIILAYLQTRGAVNSGARTYASIWIGFCLTMCLLFILAVSGNQEVLYSLAIVAPAMTGLAFFATAAIINLGWLRWIALGWWLTAILVALLDSYIYVGLIYSLAYLSLMAGPGIAIARLGNRA